MQINVSVEHGEDLVAGLDLEGLATFVLEQMKCPPNTDVSISFVTDERIHELNRDYRGIDRPTDVLSFECDNVPFEDESFDDAAEYELGDVIIATDVAERQTHEYGTTFEEEVTLLTVHGLLHLCGYDHIKDEDAVVMEALERKLIGAWNDQRAQEGERS